MISDFLPQNKYSLIFSLYIFWEIFVIDFCKFDTLQVFDTMKKIWKNYLLFPSVGLIDTKSASKLMSQKECDNLRLLGWAIQLFKNLENECVLLSKILVSNFLLARVSPWILHPQIFEKNDHSMTFQLHSVFLGKNIILLTKLSIMRFLLAN